MRRQAHLGDRAKTIMSKIPNGTSHHRLGALAVVLAGSLGCPSGPTPAPPDEPPDTLPRLVLMRIHDGLDNPTDLQAPLDDSGRLFIVEQPGRIRVSTAGMLQSPDEVFLDIRDRVTSDLGERGLLGLAFHPDFATNGRFFVNYTRTAGDSDQTVIEEYQAAIAPDQGLANRADPTPVRTLLTIDQPATNHNGGQLQFGPDGMLYVATGDGGGSCDPGDEAQDPDSLLGKLLRIDVDDPDSLVPADNPAVPGTSARQEIWSLGLRNPWRFAIDAVDRLVYIADVGQFDREEINVVALAPADAYNFGWPTFEGTMSPPLRCGVSEFAVTDPTPPILEYTHGDGCSITGGYVYRGSAIPELVGWYLYSDFCTPFLRALRMEAGALAESVDLTSQVEVRGGALQNVTSFGTDQAGEIYVLDRDGELYQLLPGDP
jgi:glucose/arabinose dehydrogenase